jgi:hypothetical protein
LKQIEKIGPKSLPLCLEAAFKKQISIGNIVKWHGAESIFLDCNLIMFPVRYYSLFKILIPDDLYKSDSEDKIKQITDSLPSLREIGNILPTCPTPWVDEQQVDWSGDSIYFIDGYDDFSDLDPEAFFGAFLLYAVWLESQNHIRLPKILNELEHSPNHLFKSSNWILLARYEPAVRNRVQAQMYKSGFTDEQQSFIWRWIRKEINLVKK